MPRKKKRREAAIAASAAGEELGSIAEAIERRKAERRQQEAKARDQAIQEGRLGVAEDRLRFDRSEAARGREAEEQARYEATLPRHKAKAYQHEIGAELSGLSSQYAERAGPLAGKAMRKGFEEAGSIDEVNALMTKLHSGINEMDKLAAYEDWYREQDPDVQDLLTAKSLTPREVLSAREAEMIYMMPRLLVAEGLKAEVKAKTQPPKMSAEERLKRQDVQRWQKFFTTANGMAYVRAVTPWEGEVDDEGKFKDPEDQVAYRKHAIELTKQLANLTDEEAEKYLFGFKGTTPEDVPEVSVGGGDDEEEFNINDVLKGE